MPVSLKKLYKCFSYFSWCCWKATGIATHEMPGETEAPGRISSLQKVTRGGCGSALFASNW